MGVGQAADDRAKPGVVHLYVHATSPEQTLMQRACLGPNRTLLSALSAVHPSTTRRLHTCSCPTASNAQPDTAQSGAALPNPLSRIPFTACC